MVVLAYFVEPITIDFSQWANNQNLKVLIFLDIFAESTCVRINVKKYLKAAPDDLFMSSSYPSKKLLFDQVMALKSVVTVFVNVFKIGSRKVVTCRCVVDRGCFSRRQIFLARNEIFSGLNQSSSHSSQACTKPASK
jgi:hypothetical protein